METKVNDHEITRVWLAAMALREEFDGDLEAATQEACRRYFLDFCGLFEGGRRVSFAGERPLTAEVWREGGSWKVRVEAQQESD